MTAADDRLFAALAARDLAAARTALAGGASAAAQRTYEYGGERTVEVASESALHAAVRSGQLELVELLLANGAAVDAREGMCGRTALCLAVAAGSLPMVAMLLRAGADPRLADGRSGDDAFALAIAEGQLVIARALRDAGAPSSERALLHACRLGRSELAGVCLRGDVTVAAAPVLTEAARFDRVAMLDWLAARGADVAKEGGPALVGACHAGAAGAVAWLLQRGAPVAFRNEYAWPPLHFAAYGGHPRLVDALLAAGADPAATCGHGRTARSWAEEAGHGAIAAALAAAEQRGDRAGEGSGERPDGVR